MVSLIANRQRLLSTRTGSLIIRRAIYGPVNTAQAGKDETPRIRNLVQNDRLAILVSHDLLGDPFPNQLKQLTVEYTFEGQLLSRITPEGHYCNLP